MFLLRYKGVPFDCLFIQNILISAIKNIIGDIKI